MLIVAAAMLAPPRAHAQTPAAGVSLSDQKAAFLALPEATRKAAQDALVWLGFYNGVVDGDFGKRTRDAILAFQASVKARADGALSAATLQALLAAAQIARQAVGFHVIDDARTGARIGAPAKLLTGRVKLDFASSADPDLGALYARLTAETATRKIAYKAIKPDAFFVVSGQDGAAKFYTRFEKSAAATPPIRGFTFAYPASQGALLDRIAIAVANSFEAFPGHAAEPAKTLAAKAPAAGAPDAGGKPAPPPGPVLAATALVIAPGKALTALNADDCPGASVGGKPVRFERTDAATGLAIIAGDFAPKAEAPRLSALTQDLVVLSFGGRRVAASPALLSGDDARPAVFAAVEKSASGGPVFDRSGALIGLVAPIAEEPKRVAGVALAAPHAIVGPDALRAFLGAGQGEPSADGAPLSAGAIAAREQGALLAVFCQK
jgi:hypothetical protein